MSDNKANQDKNQTKLNDNSNDKIQSKETPNRDIEPPKYMYVSKSAEAEKGVNELNKIATDEINKGNK
jgi:hypothetical protein